MCFDFDCSLGQYILHKRCKKLLIKKTNIKEMNHVRKLLTIDYPYAIHKKNM